MNRQYYEYYPQNLVTPDFNRGSPKSGTGGNTVGTNHTFSTAAQSTLFNIPRDLIVHHHVGLGNNTPTRKSPIRNKCTNLEPSNKFQHKLLQKQRQIEENIMANRLKKLCIEENRLQKETTKAHSAIKFANEVKDRRESEFMAKTEFQINRELDRIDQAQLNRDRKNELQIGIQSAKGSILISNNINHRSASIESSEIHDAIYARKRQELDVNKKRASEQYSHGHEVWQCVKDKQKDYYDQVLEENQGKAQGHIQKMQRHEMTLGNMAGFEDQLINKLQETLKIKNQAVSVLKQKNSGLCKTMIPRQAYTRKTKGIQNDYQSIASEIDAVKGSQHEFNTRFNAMIENARSTPNSQHSSKLTHQ